MGWSDLGVEQISAALGSQSPRQLGLHDLRGRVCGCRSQCVLQGQVAVWDELGQAQIPQLGLCPPTLQHVP